MSLKAHSDLFITGAQNTLTKSMNFKNWFSIMQVAIHISCLGVCIHVWACRGQRLTSSISLYDSLPYFLSQGFS